MADIEVHASFVHVSIGDFSLLLLVHTVQVDKHQSFLVVVLVSVCLDGSILGLLKLL